MIKKIVKQMILCMSALLFILPFASTVYAEKLDNFNMLMLSEYNKKFTKEELENKLEELISNLETNENKELNLKENGLSHIDEPEISTDGASWLQTGTHPKWFYRLGSYQMDCWSLYHALISGADGDGNEDMLIDPKDVPYDFKTEMSIYDEDDNEIRGTAYGYQLAEYHYESTDLDEIASKLDAAYEFVYEYAIVSLETFLMDHPEVFWLGDEHLIGFSDFEINLSSDGQYYVTTSLCFVTQLVDENNNIVFDIRHSNYDEESIYKGIEERQNLLESITEPVKNKEPLEQVEYFHNYLIMNNEMNYTYYSEGQRNEVFQTHPETSSCMGALRGTSGEYAPYEISYVRAFQTLCDYVELPCTIETGSAGNSHFFGTHWWNLVEINGKWYAVDTALDDLSVNTGQAVSGDESTEFLLTGKNSLVTFGDETIQFDQSHKTSNIYLSGLEYSNAPKIEDYAYNAVIESIELVSSEDNYMYGYMEAPVISADIDLKVDASDAVEYRWYLKDSNNKITLLDENDLSIRFPDISEPGTYTVYFEVISGLNKKYEAINIGVTNFKDVNESDWFCDAVDWAIKNEVTYGLNNSTFGSGDPCTRGQIVTFIWRTAGSPDPVNATNTFKDVQSDAYYYNAVLWAVENGITTGYSAEKFAPDNSCTRAEMVTFLWRVGGKEEVEDKVHSYQDVKADGFYYDAMLWAVEEGIAAGYTATKFAPDMTVTRAETVTFLYRANGNPLPTDKEEGPSKMLDKKVAADDKGVLYQIPNAYVESGLMQTVLIYENHLLVWGNGVNEKGQSAVTIAILNMSTGEPLQKKAFTGIELANVEICGEQIALTDGATGNVYLLDGGLQILKEFKGSGKYGSVYVNEDATKIYSFSTNGGITIKDIANGETKVLLEDATSLLANGRTGNTVAFTYTDKKTQINQTAVIDLNTEEILVAPFEVPNINIQYDTGLWFCNDADDTSKYYIGTEDAVYMTKLAEGQTSLFRMITSPVRFIAETYNKNSFAGLTLYNADGSFVSSCEIEEDVSFYGNPVCFEDDGGYYLIIISPEGKDMLMFWDMQATVDGEDLAFETISEEETIGTAVSKDLYVKANTLSETYGIKIKIAEFCMTDSYSYIVEQIFDETQIAEGLEILEIVLASYPEGFFEQLKYGSQRVIEIHLAGDLFSYNKIDQSYTTVAGFANSVGFKNHMVVDITAGTHAVTKTFYHEIMHLIDYRMMFDAKIREDAVYSEDVWCSFNPKGFKYVEEYNELPDGYYNDGYGKWFIDNYARTNSKEDRARIMEYAMIGDTNAFPAGSGRLNKLEYLCECIRDTFDTTGWPKVTVWEQTLADSL